MGYNFIISMEADAETISATNYYDGISPNLGTRFLAELNAVYRKIIANPQCYKYASKTKKRDLRCVKVKNFPFLIIYYLKSDDIVIISVLNTNRKNKYVS